MELRSYIDSLGPGVSWNHVWILGAYGNEWSSSSLLLPSVAVLLATIITTLAYDPAVMAIELLLHQGAKVYLQGQGDLVSRLRALITHRVTLVILHIFLLTKSP